MDLLVVTSNKSYLDTVVDAAGESGCNVVDTIGSDEDVISRIMSVCCDLVVFVSHEVGKEDLTTMYAMSNSCPKPLLVLTEDTRTHSIEAAMKAGVSGYVAGCSDLSRLYILCQVAMARFVQYRALIDELGDTKNALKQRKDIEKAKGLIMKQRHIDEEEAYRTLRKLAMDTNTRINDVARQIINAAELLL